MGKEDTKLCKHCQTEIPAGARVCPNCRKKQNGKAKWIVIALLVFFVFWLIGSFGGGENDSPTEPKTSSFGNTGSETNIDASVETSSTKPETSAKSPEQSNDPKSDDTVDVDIAECNIKYVKHELLENTAGEKCLAVYYEFTNNSEEAKAFMYCTSDKAFQNGVQLETSMFHVNEESKNSDKEIKPGVSITVCSGFVLNDEESDVELEIEDFISLKEEPEDKMILSLK